MARYRLYAQFDSAGDVVQSVSHFHILSGSPVFFHADTATGGQSSSSTGTWSPSVVTNASAFDSWVSIGSTVGSASSTVSDSGWGAAGFAQAQIPAGAALGSGPGWRNAQPNGQGAVDSVRRILLGQFVVAADAPQCTVNLKLTYLRSGDEAAGYVSDVWSLPATGAAQGWGLVGYSQMQDLSGVAALAAGGISSMALRSDGTIGAWGYNGSGQCSVPPGLGPASFIRMGDGHSVALVEGTVVCWGRNDFGQLNVPGSLGTAIRIGAGGNHTLALTQGGTVVCWGSNQYGQSTVPATVGVALEVAGGGFHSMAIRSNGTVACWGRNDAAQCNVPATLGTVTAIAGGGQHSVALRSNGTVACWGLNLSGQSTVPGSLGSVTRIAAGFNHTVALTAAGAVVAWGANASGQSTVPSAATASVDRIAAGGNHVLARKSDGSIVAWGDNSYSQTTPPSALGAPIAVSGGYLHALAIRADGTVAAWGSNAEGQTDVPAGTGAVLELAGGEYFSLARKIDGTVVAWGENLHGQSTVPAGVGTTRRIAAGRSHALAIRSDGSIVCWGLNGNGQCNVPSGIGGAIDIAGGSFHSAAVTAAGTVVCWGLNDSGQSVPPSGLAGVRSVAARGDHTMALRTDGTVVCWGRNDYGQCDVPSNMGPIRQIVSGRDFSAALGRDGRVHVWGLGLYGQTTIPPNLGVVRSIGAGRESIYVMLGTDLCPSDPTKIVPGHCGCGASETDSDSDTLPDCADACPLNPDLIAPRTYFADSDGDGFGSPGASSSLCSDVPPAGFATNALDCNDSDPLINPSTVWYRDLDGDGFGGPGSGTVTQCLQPAGFVRNALDCNDSNPAISPATFWYRDLDGDGFGNSLIFLQQCVQPAGYVLTGGDCNDLNPALNPATIWFRDLDGDGYGSSSSGTQQQCLQPVGFVLNDLDCNDSSAAINPDTRWYRDQDGDGFGDPSQSVFSCAQPAGFVLNSGDGCPNDPSKQAPGVCGCGIADADGDADGVPSCIDNCPTVANPFQLDADGDGAGDSCDGCPADAGKTSPGQCGCGLADADADADGVADCRDVNFVQLAALQPGEGTPDSQFGWAGGLSGDFALVGAFNFDAAFSNQGKAFAFRRTPSGTWIKEAGLLSTSPSADGRFGWSVALDGEVAVIGSYLDDSVAADAGAVFVFRRNSSGSWNFEQKLLASDAALGDQFGYSVAISGSAIVVGARGHEDPGGLNRGAGYVFRRSGTSWVQEAILRAGDAADQDFFGEAVAITGDLLAISALQDDVGSGSGVIADAGSSYVFRRQGSAWTFEAKLVAGDAAANDRAGNAVAISAETVLIGAALDDAGAQLERGSAYVHSRIGGTWQQVAKLDAPDGAAGDEFGRSVGLGGDVAVIGAWQDSVNGVSNRGSAYVFRRQSSGAWVLQSKLLSAGGGLDGRFGCGISVSGGRVLIGGLLEGGGTASVFDLTRLDCNGDGAPEADQDADGVADCFDTDDDNDGTFDALDGCPSDPAKTSPGICGCGVSDVDGDGDGVANCLDGCPSDPAKTAPGACGCGVSDVDGDGDGVANCLDGCPSDPAKTAPGLCGCGVSDVDTDGDSRPDCIDNCDPIPNPDQRDCDGDSVGDACEIASGSAVDCNADGRPDDCDIALGVLADANGNGLADCCEGGFDCGFAASQWPTAAGGNGHWYQYVTAPSGPAGHVLRSDAEAYAAARGARLASITSAAEQAFIATSLSGRPSSGFTWIGLAQAPGSPEPAGGWGWSSGEPLAYTNWMTTQPDNRACNIPGLDQSFGVLSWAHGGRWDDGSDPYPNCPAPTSTFVVEWSADCNGNGVVDYGEIRSGAASDANDNLVIDCCESIPGCNGTYDVPSEFATIQAAINAIPPGTAATVSIGGGTFPGPVSLGGRDVVVRGAGIGLTFLDGTGLTSSVVRLQGEPATAGLSDLTIRNGRSGSLLGAPGSPLVGGGVFATNSSAFLRRVRFEDNSADFGGGAYFLSSTLAVEDCQFITNASERDGGGLQTYECDGAIRRSLFESNLSGLFGPGSGSGVKVVGARTAGATFVLEDSELYDNLSSVSGSAIEWYELTEGIVGKLRIDGCTVESNRSGEPVPTGAAGLRSLGTAASCLVIDSVLCDNVPRNASGAFLRSGSTVICDCLADVVQDGRVDAVDLAFLLSRWGVTEPDGLADFDSDGVVSALDLAFLLSNWGNCP